MGGVSTPSAGGPSLSGTVVTETSFGQASTAGVATTASKGDHTHGTPSASAIPFMQTNNPAYFNGITRFLSISGNNNSSIESLIQCRMPAGSIKRLRVNITVNSIDGNTTITFRNNGADTTLKVTIPANTTGIFIDDTDVITIALNDLVNFAIVIGGSMGTLIPTIMQVDFIPS